MNSKVSRATMRLVVALSWGATGCLFPNRPAESRDLGGEVQWFSYDASRRGAYLLSGPITVVDAEGQPRTEHRTRVYVEPAPDVAFEYVGKFLASANLNGIDANAKADLSKSVVELGKRTTVVSFLRESLYRLSEMASNGTLDLRKAETMFSEVIKASSTIGLAEVQSAQALRINAIRELIQAGEMKLSAEQLTAMLAPDAQQPALTQDALAPLQTAIASIRERLDQDTQLKEELVALKKANDELRTKANDIGSVIGKLEQLGRDEAAKANEIGSVMEKLEQLARAVEALGSTNDAKQGDKKDAAPKSELKQDTSENAADSPK